MKAGAKAILPTIAVVAVTALGLSQSDNITNTSSQNIVIQNVIQSEIVSTNTENFIENTIQNVVENTVVNEINNTVAETSSNIVENTTKATVKSEVENTVENKTNTNVTIKEENKIVDQPIVESPPIKSTNSNKQTNTSNQSNASKSSSTTNTTNVIPTFTTYILNTNSRKFHKPSCASVKKMKESNKKTFTGSRNDVISQGYQPCKNCNP